MSSMVKNFGYEKIQTLDLENFNISQVTDMSSMFEGLGYKSLTSLTLGSNFDTSGVTNMNSMFKDCGYTTLTSLDLGNLFKTSAVTDMTNMFNGCGKTAMAVLDLGPNFTKIADSHDGFMTDCGTSSLVVYAPEAIYSDKASFKLNKAGQ